jgi:hypothetical protein
MRSLNFDYTLSVIVKNLVIIDRLGGIRINCGERSDVFLHQNSPWLNVMPPATAPVASTCGEFQILAF